MLIKNTKTKNTFKIKKFITTNFNQESEDAYCWYNVDTVLKDQEISELKSYFDKHKYNFMLIINGCNEQRPQRTMGTFPTFLKGTNGLHYITPSYHCFILCSWLEPYNDYDEHVKELTSFVEHNDPDSYQYYIWRK